MPLVRNTRRGSFLAAGVEFKPGATELDEDALLRVLADASAASWFDCGILVLEDAGPPAVVEAAPAPITMPEIEPVDDVPMMVIPDKVKAWGEKPRGKRKGG